MAYLPETGALIVAPGLGISAGHNINFGLFVSENAGAAFSDLSLGLGAQLTPWRGVQGVLSPSSTAVGATYGVPGVAGTLT